MRRQEVIEKLKQHEAAIRAMGAQSLYLYGSCARDEAGPGSDVDLFIDQDVAKPFGFVIGKTRARDVCSAPSDSGSFGSKANASPFPERRRS